jgi:hypothetical protein
MSEIAQLRQRIELELLAMRRGLSGLSSGAARHEFIHARMNQVGHCQDCLADQVGENTATMMVCQLYVQAMEGDVPQVEPVLCDASL